MSSSLTLQLAALAVVLPLMASAGVGKWTPQQVVELGPAWVKGQGVALPLDKLWSEKQNAGLLGNAIALPQCVGSFVSPQGLIITNHHCIVTILQQHSTPEHNLTQTGFIARTRGEEKRAGAFRIQIPRAFHDVTKDVLAAIPDGAGDAERFHAIEAKEKSLVADCEKKPATRCQFATFEGGLFFTLTESTEAVGREARLRASARGRPVRRRGRQLDVAAPHRRFLRGRAC